MELWRKIEAFPDYAVSSAGRVKRVVPDMLGRIISGFIKPHCGTHGYLAVPLHKNARQYTRLVHRLVCVTFHGNAPSGKQAAHRDGDKLNNRSSNVRWLMPSVNNLEKNRHGTMRVGDNHHARYMPECIARGESHGNAKLTERLVLSIRKDRRPQRDIAITYGIAQSLVSYVKNRKIWAHVAQEREL